MYVYADLPSDVLKRHVRQQDARAKALTTLLRGLHSITALAELHLQPAHGLVLGGQQKCGFVEARRGDLRANAAHSTVAMLVGDVQQERNSALRPRERCSSANDIE